MKRSLHTPMNRIAMKELKQARIDSGKTQGQIAVRIRRPQSFISLYEKSQRGVSFSEFLEIAEAIGADTCALIKKIRRAARQAKMRLR